MSIRGFKNSLDNKYPGWAPTGVPNGAIVEVIDVPTCSAKNMVGYRSRSMGWYYRTNCPSFHEPDISPDVVCWARGPGKFRKLRSVRKLAMAAVAANKVDTCTERFRLRAMVREGD